MLIAVAVAIFALAIVERVILRRRPLWLAPLAIRLGKPRHVPIDEVTRSALVRLEADAGGYRAPVAARTDWSALDGDELRVWLSNSEITVDLAADRALLVARPRVTFFGRNRGVWALFYSLELRGQELVLTQRFYLGDVAWLLALAAGALQQGMLWAVLGFVPFYLAFRLPITYYELKDLPEALRSRLGKFLAHDEPARIGAAPSATTAADGEEDEEDASAAADRSQRR